MFKSIWRVSLNFILCFQMIFAGTGPVFASIEHEVSLRDLLQMMESYEREINGVEPQNTCTGDEPPIESRSNTSVEDILGLSPYICDENNASDCLRVPYQTDPQVLMGRRREECMQGGEDGLIKNFAKRILQMEKDERTPPVFSFSDGTARRLIERARRIKDLVSRYLYDTDLETLRRRFILILYINKVVMPSRDLVVALKSYSHGESTGIGFYEQLLMDFPTGLLARTEGDRGNPRNEVEIGDSSNPNGIKIVDLRNPRTDLAVRSRLTFEPLIAFKRDTRTLLKVPTAKNYIRALKWMTFQIMVGQIDIFNQIIGRQEPIDVPRGCGFLSDGQTLPSRITVPRTEREQGEVFIQNILYNLGLHFSITKGESDTYNNYYVSNIDLDPTQSHYNGLDPFEHFRSAEASSTPYINNRAYLSPDVDDAEHFDNVLSKKMQEIEEIFRGRITPHRGGESEPIVYTGRDLFNSILQEANPLTDSFRFEKDGSIYHIDASAQNLSKFLGEYMAFKKALSLEEAIDEDLKEELRNNEVQIKFPSLYSSLVRKTWALQVLGHFAFENKETQNRDIIRTFGDACQLANSIVHNSPVTRFCPAGAMTDGVAVIENVATDLDQYRNLTSFVPRRPTTNTGLENDFRFYDRLWTLLMQRNLLDYSYTNEYDYLMGQITNRNPWARARLGYVIAKHLLNKVREGRTRTARGRGRRHHNGLIIYQVSDQNFLSNIRSIMAKFESAGDVLKLNEVIKSPHGNAILNTSERRDLFASYLDMFHSIHNFSLQYNYNRSSTFLDIMEDINKQTFLNESSVSNYISNNLPRAIRQDFMQEINQAVNSDQGALSEFLIDLYRRKGNLAEQENLIRRLGERHGIGSDISAKRVFLDMDAKLKFPIYNDLLVKAAEHKKREIINHLSEFCDLSPNDDVNSVNQFQALFYATAQNQNQINQMGGFPQVPENVMEKINSTSPDDMRDMIFGIGGIMLHIAAISLAGTCTMATAGVCAPIAIGTLAAIGVGTAMQVDVLRNEVGRHARGSRYGDMIERMEDMGFATRGSHEGIRRSLFWVAMEVVGLLTMTATFVKGMELGTRLTVVAGRNLLRQSGVDAFRQEARAAMSASNINMAKFLLGFDVSAEHLALSSLDDRASELTALLRSRGLSTEEIENIQRTYRHNFNLMAQGRLSLDDFATRIGEMYAPLQSFILEQAQLQTRGLLGQLAATATGNTIPALTNYSIATVNRNMAKALVEYTGGSLRKFRSFVNSYASKIEKAQRLMREMETNPTLLQRTPFIGRLARWYRKMRHGHLNEYADDILKIQTDLERLARTRRGDLEAYIAANADLIAKSLVDVPLPASSIPWKMFEGIPQSWSLGFGRRAPVLGALADNTNIRNIIKARDLLIFEKYRSEAAGVLGDFANYVSVKGGRELFEKFSDAVFTAAANEGAQTTLVRGQREVEDAIVAVIESELTRRGKPRRIRINNRNYDLTNDGIRRIVFNPRNLEEEAIAARLWDLASVERILGVNQLEGHAQDVVRQLSNYNSVDQFENFLNALRVLVYNKNPRAIELF